MTPGAGTAQSVGRVGYRQMWRVAAGLRFCCGRFVVLRRSSRRHKWSPYVCERLTVVLRRSSGRRKWRRAFFVSVGRVDFSNLLEKVGCTREAVRKSCVSRLLFHTFALLLRHESILFLFMAIVAEIIATSTLKASEQFTRLWPSVVVIYNPQIQIFAESKTKRSDFGLLHKTKRSKNRRAHNIKSSLFRLLFWYHQSIERDLK